MLNNLGGLGSFGLNGSGNHPSSLNGSSGTTNLFLGLDESGNSGLVNGTTNSNGSMKSSNGSSPSGSTTAGPQQQQQQQQQRVLVAN